MGIHAAKVTVSICLLEYEVVVLDQLGICLEVDLRKKGGLTIVRHVPLRLLVFVSVLFERVTTGRRERRLSKRAVACSSRAAFVPTTPTQMSIPAPNTITGDHS